MSTNLLSDLFKHLDRIKTNEEEYLISIVIPVHNESKTIGTILTKLPNRKDIEIIVVDDYSSDNSINEIEKIMKFRNINLLKNILRQKTILSPRIVSKITIIESCCYSGAWLQHYKDRPARSYC